jgi:hypothetical protein
MFPTPLTPKSLIMRFFVVSLLLLAAFVGCNRKNILDTVVKDVYTPPVKMVLGTIGGRVVTEAGVAVPNATVVLDSYQTQTDADGVFSFVNKQVNSKGVYIKVEHTGYFPASRMFSVTANSKYAITLTMMPMTFVAELSAQNGGTASFEGAQIVFPANGIVRADGSAYNGTVKVAARWLRPDDDKTIEIMPGNLIGISDDNREEALVTYGMMAVELHSPNNEPLQLKEGTSAELSFPLPVTMAASAPAQIPLWHFDEETGWWREEGVATKTGNKYVGQVSHFSFWNCDVGLPLVQITGQAVNQDNQPIAHQHILCTLENQGLTGYNFTNESGHFSGAVPSGFDLIFQIQSACSQVVPTVEVPALSSDTDLGSIVFEMNGNFAYNFAGTVICSGSNVDINFFYLKDNNGKYWVVNVNSEGGFNAAIYSCDPISSFSFPVSFGIDPIMITGDTTEVDIDICSQTGSIFGVTIDSLDYSTLTNVVDSLIGDEYKIIANDSNTGVYAAVVFSTNSQLPGQVLASFTYNDGNGISVFEEPVEINVDQFGPIGSTVSGSFSSLPVTVWNNGLSYTAYVNLYFSHTRTQ